MQFKASQACFTCSFFIKTMIMLKNSCKTHTEWIEICKVESVKSKVQSRGCKVGGAKSKVQSRRCNAGAAESKVQSRGCKVRGAKSRVQSRTCKVEGAKSKMQIWRKFQSPPQNLQKKKKKSSFHPQKFQCPPTNVYRIALSTHKIL